MLTTLHVWKQKKNKEHITSNNLSIHMVSTNIFFMWCHSTWKIGDFFFLLNLFVCRSFLVQGSHSHAMVLLPASVFSPHLSICLLSLIIINLNFFYSENIGFNLTLLVLVNHRNIILKGGNFFSELNQLKILTNRNRT